MFPVPATFGRDPPRHRGVPIPGPKPGRERPRWKSCDDTFRIVKQCAGLVPELEARGRAARGLSRPVVGVEPMQGLREGG